MKRILVTLILIAQLSLAWSYSAKDMQGFWYMATNTPIGINRGKIEAIFIDEHNFYGSINMFNHDNEFSNGYFLSDAFAFSGKIRFLLSNIAFEAIGTINDDGNVTATIETRMGEFKAVAARSEEELESILNKKPFKK